MASFVAFLRAINLGKNRRVPMAQLQETLVGAGFTDVRTYLATGNVLVDTSKRSRGAVEGSVERALAAAFDFEVPTIAFRPAELAALHAEATALGVYAQRRYLTFLKEAPPPSVASELDGWDESGEGAKVLGRAVYWWIDHPNAAALMSNARLEKQLGTATTRDLKVVATITERWCSG